MSEKKKVTVIGNPEEFPRVFFGEDELHLPISAVDFGIDFCGDPYVSLRIETGGLEFKRVD